MAKKTLSAFDIIKKIDDSAMIVAENENAEVKEFIGTGSYILNACITGSILKGIPSGRMTVLSGDPGTGKTFVALSVCREAQKMGYTPIYLDSENAVDKDSMERLGIDTNKIILMNVNVITDVSNFMANLVVELDELKKKNKEEDIPKFLLVLDSLGNLTSSKEKEEMEKSGTPKRDMTKQQEIKAMFRVNTVGLARMNIPLIVTSHSYSCLSPDTQVLMKDNQVKQLGDITVGEFVMTKDGPKEVLETFTYEDIPSHYELEFEDGTKIKCTAEHKFLCNIDGKEEWVTAEDLTSEHDIITA